MARIGMHQLEGESEPRQCPLKFTDSNVILDDNYFYTRTFKIEFINESIELHNVGIFTVEYDSKVGY